MINGEEFGWEDLSVVIGGKMPVGITMVDYATKQEKKNIYGRGADPVARGRGRREYDAKIGVLQSELEALIASSPDGDLTKLPPFTVVVAYSPKVGDRVITDALLYCEFTEFKKELKEGDTNMVVELPMVVGQIKYNQ